MSILGLSPGDGYFVPNSEYETDISENFANAIRHFYEENESRAEELSALRGEETFAESLASCRAKLELVNKGSVQRTPFAVTRSAVKA